MKDLDFSKLEQQVDAYFTRAEYYDSIAFGDFHKGDIRMALMIPDGNRPQREDFVWCLPIPTDDWLKIHALADKFKGVAPNGIRYVRRIGARQVAIILVLWHEGTTSEDQILEACAYLRLIKDMRQPIYIVPHSRDQASITSLIQRSMGENPMLIQSTDSLGEDKA